MLQGSGLSRFLLKLAQSCSLCETFRETPLGRCRLPQLPVVTSSLLCMVSWSSAIEAPITKHHRWDRWKQHKFISQLPTL